MLKYLILASVFLFNPLVSNIDILPDAIAYLLIMKALSKVSYIYDFAEEAYNGAKKMLIVSLAKLGSLMLISASDPTMSLLLSFTFMVIELIFGIPMISKLFSAFSKMALNGENGEVANASDKMKHFTILVFSLRLIFAMLPDLTALSINNGVDTQTGVVGFKPMLFVFSVFFSLIMNTVWLVKIILYLKRLCTRAVIERCEIDFKAQMSGRSALFESKNKIRAMLLILVSSVFVVDFSWEGFNLALDFVFTLVVVLSFGYFCLKKLYKPNTYSIVLVILLIAQGAVNIFEAVLNNKYYSIYNLESVFRISEAEDMYFNLSVSSVLTGVLFVATAILISFIIVKNGKNYLIKYKDLLIVNNFNDIIKEYNHGTQKCLIYVIISAVLSGVCYAIMVIFKPYTLVLVLVNMIFNVIFIISFMHMVSYVNEESHKRILSHS